MLHACCMPNAMIAALMRPLGIDENTVSTGSAREKPRSTNAWPRECTERVGAIGLLRCCLGEVTCFDEADFPERNVLHHRRLDLGRRQGRDDRFELRVP